ncbi:PaaI family thioesterase [Caenispirillum bisanense]|uniref:PaaI family thioesterase n=1 Tax=Caenispirillum bisanense TaxID=414052 RepID=UPI0031E0D4F7
MTLTPPDIVSPPPAVTEAEALRARVLDSFSRQGLMEHLGARLVDVERGMVRIRLPFSRTLTQQHGFFHAGATTSIADSAAGYAAFTTFPEGSTVLSVEFKINLVAPARGEWLDAVGSVIRAGRTLTICQSNVYGVSEGKETLVATGLVTLIRLPDADDRPAG